MIKMEFKLKEYNKKRNFKEFVIGGDVGGTNINFGIAGVKNKKPKLLFSLHYKTKKLKNLHSAINHALDFAKSNYNIKIKKACLAVAGVVKGHYAETQNIKWDIDTKTILKKTKLKSVFLINDFEAIGYGVNLLKEKDLHKLNNNKPEKNKVKAVIGAGSGLGKTILHFDKNLGFYVTLPTEGGHVDFAAQNKEELGLVSYVQKLEKTKRPITLELVLSGPGLERIYDFVKSKIGTTQITKEVDKSKEKAALISKFKNKDKVCKKTFEIFKKNYAKACKDFALTTLSFGGLYIAGGVAAKNLDIFDKKFMNEFQNNFIFHSLLKKIPIFVIKNYDVSLYGSIFVAAIHT